MITFENVSKQYGSTVLLDCVNVSIHNDRRTGLVGVNGSGKTTLLRMLSGEEHPDSGSVIKPPSMTIGYLPQEVEVLDTKTPLEIVLEPFSHILDFEKQLESVSENLHKENLEKSLQRIDSLFEAAEFHDIYSLTARARAILAGLGIPEQNWTEPVEFLSGGFRMRAVLGRLLLSAPNFLLLDEPTNHLDMDSLVWLEKYLERQKCGMLIVSHDRDFLNRITDYTAEISSKTLTLYKGNYDQYIESRAEAQQSALNRAKNLQLKIAQTERFVERFKAKATKATQAQSRMKLLDKLKAEMPELESGSKQIHFSFPEVKQSGTVPVKIINLSAGYGERTVLSRVSLNVNRGDKIAIVGPNGAGKSTLLKTIAGMVQPSAGNIEIGHNVEIRVFGQHQLEQLDPERTLYDTVMKDSVSTEKTFVRNVLGAFLFSGDDVEKRVEVLSGGEKARLVLATLLASPGNVLLLDEPTNHLDIDSVGKLADAMTEFKGTIIFVSHDEYFISRIATRIVEIRPGMIRDFPGTLEDYRSYVEAFFSGEKESPEINRQTVPDEKEIRIKERENRKKLTRIIEKLEMEISTQESKITELSSVLNDPANASNHELLHSTTLEIESIQAQIDKLMSDWENRQLQLQESDSGK
ncbi:MAG: ABC-F family ATP-binding cassette domain-containing protein [Fibrobacter sp.]|nr:ABC-F family ATP-binding cassette domain-containing protein [Fibrobacter sp.]